MPRKNRTCYTCGEKYSYCPSCDEDKHLENWHIMFDSENCKKIFEILNERFFSHISDTEALARLKRCNLSGLESFQENIRSEIKKLRKLEPQGKELVKPMPQSGAK